MKGNFRGRGNLKIFLSFDRAFVLNKLGALGHRDDAISRTTVCRYVERHAINNIKRQFGRENCLRKLFTEWVRISWNLPIWFIRFSSANNFLQLLLFNWKTFPYVRRPFRIVRGKQAVCATIYYLSDCMLFPFYCQAFVLNASVVLVKWGKSIIQTPNLSIYE